MVKRALGGHSLTGYRIDIKSASEYEEMEASQEPAFEEVESDLNSVDE